MICSRAACSELRHTSTSTLCRTVSHQAGHHAGGRLAGLTDIDARNNGRGRDEQVRSEENWNNWKWHGLRSQLVLTVEHLEHRQKLVRSGGKIAEARAGRV